MQILFESREETGDFIIIVNGEKLKCHKTILQARSGLFRNMFLNVQDESNEVKDYSGLSPKAMIKVLEFMYTGNMSNVTEEIKKELEELNYLEYFQINN